MWHDLYFIASVVLSNLVSIHKLTRSQPYYPKLLFISMNEIIRYMWCGFCKHFNPTSRLSSQPTWKQICFSCGLDFITVCNTTNNIKLRYGCSPKIYTVEDCLWIQLYCILYKEKINLTVYQMWWRLAQYQLIYQINKKDLWLWVNWKENSHHINNEEWDYIIRLLRLRHTLVPLVHSHA